ncbi:MAG: branched-chain amino acid transaminase [bacterium]
MIYTFFNGEFVPSDDAKINVRNNSFNYGTAIFEGIRGYWNVDHKQMYIIKMKEHYKRLMQGSRFLNFNLPYKIEDYCDITLDLIKRNNHKENTYIRPLVYYTPDKISPKFIGYEAGFTLYTVPMGDYIDTSKGIRVCVSTWRRISDNMVPARFKMCGIYVNSALAKTEALERGFDEAIMLNVDGHVAEGSAENIFIIRDGNLITPSLSDDILEGITRKALITLCEEDLNLKVIERKINRTELYICDEAFLCGTGAQVAPVIEVDGHKTGDGRIGSITRKIQKLYFEIVRGESNKYSEWRTPVY